MLVISGIRRVDSGHNLFKIVRWRTIQMLGESMNQAMKLPNWFRIAWWLLLTSLLSAFLYKRYPDLVAGSASVADVIVFLIWIALLLAPLFNEVSLLGITLKQQIEEFKNSVSTQIADLRTTVDVRSSINQQFTMPLPASDAKLPEIEAMLKKTLTDILSEQGREQGKAATVSAPDDVVQLFAARYSIEKELRRIAEGRQLFSGIASLLPRSLPVSRLSTMLVEAEVIDRRLSSAIREVYAVCSPAIHGEPVSEAQLSFVKDVAPGLISALQAVP